MTEPPREPPLLPADRAVVAVSAGPAPVLSERLRLVEMPFVVVVLVLSTMIFKYDLPHYAHWAVIYLLTATIALIHGRAVIAVARRNPLLWVFVAFVLASVLWSAEPSSTLRRGAGLVGKTLFGAYVVARFPRHELLRLLSMALAAVILVNLLMIVVVPDRVSRLDDLMLEGTDPVVVWRGAFTHKNVLGSMMALALLVFAVRLGARPRDVWSWAGLSGATLLLVMSDSRVSQLAAGVMALALLGVLAWQRVRSSAWRGGLLVLGALLVTIAVGSAERALGLIGRELTFTGRVPLWRMVIDAAWQRPWLGWGYGGFWEGHGRLVAQMWRRLGWRMEHAHNNYVDIWLQFGFVGSLLFAALAIGVFWRAASICRWRRDRLDLWPLTILLFLAAANLGESLLFHPGIFWIFFVTAALWPRPEELSEDTGPHYDPGRPSIPSTTAATA